MQHFRASDGLNLAYTIDDFTDPWIEAPTLLNLLEAFFPRMVTAAMQTTAISATSRAYSTSEAPRSVSPNLARR